MASEKALEEFKGKLMAAWCQATSYYKEQWTPENPACGQCLVSSMLVQDRFGGSLIFADAILPDGTLAEGGHFYNEIGGKRVDLTESQFPAGTQIIKKQRTLRYFVEQNADTMARYNLLKRRMPA
jgi:hypothetical protein